MNTLNLLNPPTPAAHDHRITWGNLHGSSPALAISELATKVTQPILVITPDIHSAHYWQRELQFFNAANELPILRFPDWETLPYDHFSPHADLISERLLTLYNMSNLTQGIIIAALPTILHRLCPNTFLHANALALTCKQVLNLTHFQKQLAESGYHHVDQVMEHGEFAVRGSIIDIFPMGNKNPFRIELFDNEIESIRHFDPETQRSSTQYDNIKVLPAREYPLNETSITHFRNQWRERFAGNPMDAPMYMGISQGEAASGIEYYLPLFFEKLASFFDYLPDNTLVVFPHALEPMTDSFWQEVKERYEQLRYDLSRPLCEPKEIFLPVQDFFQALKPFTQIHCSENSTKLNFPTKISPDLRVNHKDTHPLQNVTHFLADGKRALFCAESAGRREIVLDLLRNHDINPTVFPDWHSYIESNTTLGMTVAPLDSGMWITDPEIAVITETQLFGEQVMQRRLRKQQVIDPSTLIRNLTELNIGAPVVHITHGVGRYRGLKHLTTGDMEAEYLVLEYENSDIIYVPVSALHLISRYTGNDSEHAPLHRLGSRQWEKTKQQAAKRVRDMAVELLALYSKREATPGFSFKQNTKEYDKFAAGFPFEETPDQAQAINAVIADMEKPRAMDRLICGDVGFGKTEVAMRAAFMAANAGKQVAVLVPTTLLANQHLQNFQDRFADWPIKIAGLSRMRTKKEIDDALAGLAKGTVDIIIGTHKLLSNDVKFKDLGLLIVDEEHRFGVRHKERIKALRAHVDILTLTATPIPRTLNMALSGIRDLSIIATPPSRRLSIKTFVHESNPNLIREAMLRETLRGGQIYFMHNRVETIHGMNDKLRTIMPEARIAIAHGQMPERELERVMSDFYHQKYNVLLCTSIIESGIDVPSANTIIIDRADRFGLAQLHQIRGRVGRSHHQAYAYLLVPDKKSMTSDAKKRLEAISALEDLGAGFNLATHDLEIRGAGEFLGEAQSGQIESIGFSLFMDMLDHAITALKAGQDPELEQPLDSSPEIDLHLSAFIPEDYISDVHLRLTLYKRLSNCTNVDEVQQFKAEMIDRFGKLPSAVLHLLKITDIKLLSQRIGIKKVDVGKQFAYIHFNEKPNIDPALIINLIQTQSQTYQLQGSDRLRFAVGKTANDEARIEMTNKVLQLLMPRPLTSDI